MSLNPPSLFRCKNLFAALSFYALSAPTFGVLAHSDHDSHHQMDANLDDQAYHAVSVFPWQDDMEFSEGLKAFACTKASATQKKQVDLGRMKTEKFIARCKKEAASSRWCDQVIRPNPSSKSTFQCTYGASQPHRLVHPDETTWKHAIGAINLVRKLEGLGIKVCQINNWWRPEPYNKNVGGAAGRHPFGTAVDVRFCSNSDANKAFTQLCRERRAGKIRAIGHYGSSVLHLGVGDRTANTWGRSCP